MIPKVLAYITRDTEQGRQLLVFHHVHHPEAGIQVPGGTVEEGEPVLASLWREVEEETGITNLRLVGQIAKAPFYAEWRDEWQERNVFHLEAAAELPHSWTHVVKAGIEDKGLHFAFSWIPLDEAKKVLRWGQGQWLDLIIA